MKSRRVLTFSGAAVLIISIALLVRYIGDDAGDVVPKIIIQNSAGDYSFEGHGCDLAIVSLPSLVMRCHWVKVILDDELAGEFLIRWGDEKGSECFYLDCKGLDIEIFIDQKKFQRTLNDSGTWYIE